MQMPPRIVRAPFHSRANFATYLNECNLVGWAAEIGTHRGEFAEEFLAAWQGQLLHCIDHWAPGYCEEDPASGGDRQADFREAKNRLRHLSSRVAIVREESQKAAKRFDDGTLDFVYIDATHCPARAVLDDLQAWWPKLRPIGLLAGHDIVNGGGDGPGWSRFVMEAALLFGDALGLPLYLVAESNLRNWSFYFQKPPTDKAPAVLENP